MAGRITSGERVAIRRGPDNPRNADGRPGSSHILDNHRLADVLGKLRCNQARHAVGAATRRETDDPVDRLRRISALRPRAERR